MVATPPPVLPFDVASLSDEFTCPQEACTVQDNGWTEQYTDRYDSAVISNDSLVVSPGESFNDNVWFEESHGSMISKFIPTGTDFVVETRVNTRLVDDSTAAPNDNWNVGGLVLRSTEDLDDWVVLKSSPTTSQPTSSPSTSDPTTSPSTAIPTNPPPFVTTANYNPDGTVEC